MLKTDSIQITPEILSLIAKIDEFKGAWRALGTLAPDRLSALRRVATIESIGSSTRIEGSKLSDREVEQLLSNLEIKSFATRDEQEVAGYAELMDLVFSSWQDIPFTENHIKQLHQILLHHSEKDTWHRGNYKTNSNSVAAFDETGAQIGIVFQTASPFDTPRLMTELVSSLLFGCEVQPIDIEEAEKQIAFGLRAALGVHRSCSRRSVLAFCGVDVRFIVARRVLSFIEKQFCSPVVDVATCMREALLDQAAVTDGIAVKSLLWRDYVLRALAPFLIVGERGREIGLVRRRWTLLKRNSSSLCMRSGRWGQDNLN